MSTPLNILRHYSKIIITGCQRSGTNIMGTIVAMDLGYKYYDECYIDIDNATKLLDRLNNENNIVIHCPGMSHLLHTIKTPRTIIVWMLRPLDEIHSSMLRIKWCAADEIKEKNKYDFLLNSPLITVTYDDGIEHIKTQVWRNIQRPQMLCPYLEIDYHCTYIKTHHMYVPPDERRGFRCKQIRLYKDNLH